jgi:hypothetical protein
MPSEGFGVTHSFVSWQSTFQATQRAFNQIKQHCADQMILNRVFKGPMPPQYQSCTPSTPSWSTALDARAAQPAHKLAQLQSVGLLQYPQAVRESTNRRNNSNHLQTPGHLPAVVAPLAAEAFYRSRHTVSSY